MKQFFIGVGVGALLTAFLLLRMRGKMLYRVAYHDGGKWSFAPAVYTDISSVHILAQGNMIGAEFRVFGASTYEKLDQMLSRHNTGQAAVWIKASDLLHGVPFSDTLVAQREKRIEEEEIAGDIAHRRRLEFYRWMVQTGRISEEVGV